MNIVNLTPHAISIYDEDGDKVVVINPSGTEARIETNRQKANEIKGWERNLPLFKTTAGKPIGLPAKSTGTIYIVSGMFRSHVRRDDLYQPGELIRDDKVNPIGCIGLSQ